MQRYASHWRLWRGASLWRVCLALLATGWLARPLDAAAYPASSGRVTDAASILDPAARDALVTKLKALEDKSGIQLVVATVKSLEGNDIAPYANALFREWKLGEAGKNNGVLLLVAPNERKVRIEVGYGLEGRLTDAVTKIIIINFIAPSFKVGDYAGGIARGVDGLINTLTEDAAEWHGKAKRAPLTFTDLLLALTPLVIFGGIFYVIWRLVSNGARKGAAALQKRRGKYKNSSGKWVRDDAPYVASSSSSGSSSWSSSSSSSSSSTSSDSFSGGGGSSGGGGASGDW